MNLFASYSPINHNASYTAPTSTRPESNEPQPVLFNSLTRRLEPFVSIKPNEVRMYTCGLTVNDVMHLGHARAYVIWDVLKRYLEYLDYKVFHVSNVTDISVDDKILRRVSAANESFQQHINRYTQSYFEDRLKLGIALANVHPLATQHIQEMIELIERLMEKGFAYEAEDGVHFRISRFEGYGKLSGMAKDALEVGSSGRVSKDEYSKEEVGDFVLWKKSRPGEPHWHSPWGPGRPGWHIECSAMAMKYLGETFDIHCGGEEHIFPHHENEIAQSKALTGKPPVRYWLHVRHLLLEGRKMSKSTDEFVSVRNAVEQYGALPVRIFLLSTHYRKTMSFDQNAFQAALKHADRFSALWATVEHFSLKGQQCPSPSEERLLLQLQHSKSVFEEALNRDLSTPLALSAMLKLAQVTSGHLDIHGAISRDTASLIRSFLKSTGTVLFGSLMTSELEQKNEGAFKDLVEFAIEQRNRLRAEGKYDEGDLVRNRLEQIGIVLQDLPKITVWRRVHRQEESHG